MTFRPEESNNFMKLFSEVAPVIRRFEGCEHVELLRQKVAGNVFFTYSLWKNEESLDKYRFSPFFKDTWTKTKALFSEPAEAWSLEKP